MPLADLLTALRRNRSAIEAEGARALCLYGSRARGEECAGSDVDLFVDHDPAGAFNLLNLAGVKIIADGALGLAAHVTTRSSLNPRLRDRIEADAVRVF
jgi:uncharacterized protein